MDQAWALEEDFWKASTSGDLASYYARVLAADGYVVMASGILERPDLLRQVQDRPTMADYALSDQRITLVNGETVVLTYRVEAREHSGRVYRARVSSVYVWTGGGWALTLRQHSAEPETTMDMTLR